MDFYWWNLFKCNYVSSIIIQPQLQMWTLKNSHTPSKDSIEQIKAKSEQSRNNTFQDAILGLLMFAIKMFLLENKSKTMNNNIVGTTHSDLWALANHRLGTRQC
jgi:hypothetical protein